MISATTVIAATNMIKAGTPKTKAKILSSIQSPIKHLFVNAYGLYKTLEIIAIKKTPFAGRFYFFPKLTSFWSSLEPLQVS